MVGSDSRRWSAGGATGPETEVGIHVLHVDDEPRFVDVVGDLLEAERDRFSVETTTDPERALRRATAEGSPVDCVVSDYEMPGMDGLELLATIRDERPDLPFLLFTGAGSERLASEAISAGVDDYVRKGDAGQYALLANRIENAVESYRDAAEAERARRRFRSLVEDSSDVVVVLDEEGVFQYVAPSAERVWGYSPEEMVGESGFDYVHPEHRDRVRSEFEAFLAGDDSMRLECRFRHGERGWRWMESRGRDRRGDPPIDGVIVHTRDVTERKERERELERYREIVETAGDAMFVLDPDGTIRMANAAFAELSGIPEDEMAGTHATEYLTEAVYRRGTEALLSVLDEGDTSRGRFEFTGGNFPNSDRRFETILTPITDEDGGLAGSVGVVRDVTEHRERERRLERTNERLRTIVDNVPVVLFALDGEGTFTLSEGRALSALGLEPGEAVGESVFEMYGDLPRIVEATRAALDGERTHVTTEVAGRAFETWFEPVVEDGAVERVVGVAIDVTERRERERELERQNERLDRFASLVSHDLRNHLQVAAGRVQTAREDPTPESVAGIGRAVDRMADLVEDLTTLAREGGSVEEDDTDPVSVDAVASTCWSGIDAPGIDLCVEDDVVVEADRSKLRQLVGNLLRNSVEHGSTGSRPTGEDGAEHDRATHGRSSGETEANANGGSGGSPAEGGTPADGGTRSDSPADGAISRVELGPLEGDGAEPAGFYVEDDGAGIPPAERGSVFDPGYSGTEDGSGFGLFIVREIARAHGWTVEVGEGTEGGARFEVRTDDR